MDNSRAPLALGARDYNRAAPFNRRTHHNGSGCLPDSLRIFSSQDTCHSSFFSRNTMTIARCVVRFDATQHNIDSHSATLYRFPNCIWKMWRTTAAQKSTQTYMKSRVRRIMESQSIYNVWCVCVFWHSVFLQAIWTTTQYWRGQRFRPHLLCGVFCCVVRHSQQTIWIFCQALTQLNSPLLQTNLLFSIIILLYTLKYIHVYKWSACHISRSNIRFVYLLCRVCFIFGASFHLMYS